MSRPHSKLKEAVELWRLVVCWFCCSVVAPTAAPAAVQADSFNYIHPANKPSTSLAEHLPYSQQSAEMPPAAAAGARSLSVCIIGAGACGLIAAKQFASHGHTPLILEQTTHTAGTWHYTPHPSPYSAMYDQLITNLPHDVMQASDLPFPPDTPTYPHRSVVDDYIVRYETVNDLTRLVRFQSTVRRIEVRQETETGGGRYEVYYSRPSSLPALSNATLVVKDGVEGEDSSGVALYVQQFDAVCVCNGHFSVPYYPPIAGLNPPATLPSLDSLRPSSTTAPPVILHSFHYRSPRSFAGLRVLVVGSGHSGTDTAGELCDTADRVYLSSRRSPEADNIHCWVVERLRNAGKHVCVDSDRYERVGALLAVNTDGTVTVSADSESQQRQLPVDVVLLATGYHYSFPFLESSSSITISTADLHVSPLYGSLFHPDHGGFLSFPALQWSLVPFPYCELQCEWVARVLSNNCTLPDAETMREAAAAEERLKESLGKRGRFMMQCDSMVSYVHWVVEQMRQFGCDDQYEYTFTVDEDRRVRRKSRSLQADHNTG